MDALTNILTWPHKVAHSTIRVHAVLDGDPLSKQRPKFSTSRGGKVYTPRQTREAEDAIAWTIQSQHRALIPDDASTFGVRVLFYTKSYQRRDIDNMCKLVFDACTGVVWKDDTQVIELVSRLFRATGQTPRTELVIYTIGKDIRAIGTCEACGKEFRLYQSWAKRRFCSRHCYAMYVRVGQQVNCSHCGTPTYRAQGIVQKSKNGKFFCSEKCRALHHRVEVLCIQCGESFERPKSFQGLMLCSHECRSVYWTARPGQRQPVITIGYCQDCGRGVSRKEYTRCHECGLRNYHVTIAERRARKAQEAEGVAVGFRCPPHPRLRPWPWRAGHRADLRHRNCSSEMREITPAPLHHQQGSSVVSHPSW